ncbi:MAG: hypothetical protein S4CHLAM123_07040 [Chlamydiales bacterium]|nr:hypothetical protein [Chlamydiales bacterium]
MFRRPGKNPLDENNSLYEEESPIQSPYSQYGLKKNDAPPRVFDPPHSLQPTEMHEESWGHSATTPPLPHHFEEMTGDDEPETTLGEGVTFRGELSFERFLRIDGTFEGELLSQGKVIVGPQGKVRANLNLREAIIEGEIEGNITVQEKLELRGEAYIKGNIIAKSLCVDEGVKIVGHLTITPESEMPPETSEV